MALLRSRKTDIEPAAPRALTAATVQVDLGDESSWKTWKFGNRDWQKEGWRLYDIVGEHHKLCGRIGDSVAKARLYVTEVDETGEEAGETKDERIARFAAVPLGTGAQRDDNLRLSGIDLGVGGECWMVGEGVFPFDENTVGNWFVVTSEALKREGSGGPVKVKRPQTRGGNWLTLTDGVDVLIRCWRPHPNDTDQADSFTRSAIVVLREIELLTKREFAELDSRLTGAGVWLLPEGIDFPREEEDPAGIAGFMAYMQRAVAASMTDQSSARAMVPIMATIPDEMVQHLDQIKPINFWSELSAEVGPMKTAAIERLATFAEIPKETLSGISEGNHWSAWLVTEEGIRWIGGYLSLIADALTRGFLRPVLTAMGVADPERFAYAFDTSTLAAKPNRMDDALKLRDKNLLSDAETVKAGAFDPDTQMPTQEELVRQLLMDAVRADPTLLTNAGIQTALGLPTIEPTVSVPSTVGEEPAQDPVPAVEGPPNGGTPPAQADDDDSLAVRLEQRTRLALSAPPVHAVPSPEAVLNASARLMVYRALELAGGRLTTPAERRGSVARCAAS